MMGPMLQPQQTQQTLMTQLVQNMSDQGMWKRQEMNCEDRGGSTLVTFTVIFGRRNSMAYLRVTGKTRKTNTTKMS